MNSTSFGIYVSFLVRLHDKVAVEKFVDEIRTKQQETQHKRGRDRITMNVSIYTDLIRLYVYLNDYKKAVELYDEMKEKKIVPKVSTNNLVLKAYGELKLLHESHALYKKMKEDPLDTKRPDKYTYATMMRLCDTTSDSAKLDEIITDISESGRKLDAQNYALAISVYERLGHREKAKVLFYRMRADGFIPNEITYTRMISLYGLQETDVEKAESVLAEMKKYGLKPNVATFMVLVKMYARAGDIINAEKTLNEMIFAGWKPNSATYLEVLDMCLNLDRIEDLIELVRKMVSRGHLHIVTYTQLINKLAKKNKLREAETLFQEMITHGGPLLPNAWSYGIMIHMYSRLGDEEQAEYLYKQMEDQEIPINQVIFTEMIDLHRRAGNINRVNELYAEAKKKKIPLDVVAYSSLMDAHRLSHNEEQTLQIFQEMIKRRVKPNEWPYTILLNMYRISGKYEEAEELFRQMMEKGPTPNVVTINTMINMYAKIQKIPQAEKYFSEMKLRGITPDVVTYTSMIEMYRKIQDHVKAEKIIMEMKERNVRPNLYTYSILLDTYGKITIELAEELFEQVF